MLLRSRVSRVAHAFERRSRRRLSPKLNHSGLHVTIAFII